ncbi:hypothetical protein MMC12_008191 [Toensbergia leucococca]|nr:hypothetical protein [Toensbergia leucococca]
MDPASTLTFDTRTFFDTLIGPRVPSPKRGLPYSLDKKIITTDLSNERPIWILSSYGPGIRAPRQLFGSHPREQSFEELRLRHYELAASGNQQQAIQEAQTLVSNAEQQMQTALRDIDGAIDYVIDGENEHPNRIDVCNAKGAPPTNVETSNDNPRTRAPAGQSTTFVQPSTSFVQPPAPISSFGQPSAPILPANPFSQQPSTFGQPSSFGRPATTFGQPTPLFGQPSTSAPTFGQPSAPPAPGQASIFGRTQSVSSAYGTTSTSVANPQTSAASALSKNPFGQPSISAPTNTFSQPTAPLPTAAFGKPSLAPLNAFGQPSIPSTTTSFGQPSSAPSNPFNQTAASSNSNPFSQTSAPSNPFGQPSGPSTATVSSNPTDTQRSNNPRAQQGSESARITTWKGKPVTYVDDEPCFKRDDGQWEKIWFPHGPPVFDKPDYPDSMYDEKTKEDYMYMREHGAFKDGIIPLLPPKREWCRWDF